MRRIREVTRLLASPFDFARCGHKARFVRPDDELSTVPGMQLREQVPDMVFTVAGRSRRSTARRLVEGSRGAGGRRVKSAISRRITVGASRASPVATTRTP